jgi:hypothetical protein
MTNATEPTKPPTKPPEQSVTMWTAMVTFILGIAAQFGVAGEFADFINANVEQVVGAVLAVVGLVTAYGRLKAKKPISL